MLPMRRVQGIDARRQFLVRLDAFSPFQGAIIGRIAWSLLGKKTQIDYVDAQNQVEEQQAIKRPAINRNHHIRPLMNASAAFHAMIAPTRVPTIQTTIFLVVLIHCADSTKCRNSVSAV